MTPDKVKTTESQEQRLVVAWFKAQYPQYRLIAIPNGAWVAGIGNRRFALINKYKAEGMTPGVSDLYLCVSNKYHHGMWIEMKSKGKKLSDNQAQWREDMILAGYCCITAYSFERAKAEIEDYLKEA